MNFIARLAFSAAIFLPAAAAVYASSSSTLYECNGCTPGQIYNMTISLAQSNDSLGPIYIANFTGHTLTGSTIEREPNGNGGYSYSADPATIPQNVQNGFNAWYSVIVQYNIAGTIIAVVPTPRPNGYPTSIDAGTGLQWATTGTYLNLFENFATNLQADGVGTLSFPPAVDAVLLANSTGITVPNYDPVIQFVITTTSQDTVRINWVNASASILKITDSLGNSIPLNRSGVGGRYVFDGTTVSGRNYANSFAQYLNSLGARIDIPDGDYVNNIECAVGVIEGCTYDDFPKPN